MYIYAACLPLSNDSFPAALLHPNSSPLIYCYPILGIGGVLWVRVIFRARSPPPGQHAKICLLLAIRLDVRVNSWILIKYNQIFSFVSSVIAKWRIMNVWINRPKHGALWNQQMVYVILPCRAVKIRYLGLILWKSIRNT